MDLNTFYKTKISCYQSTKDTTPHPMELEDFLGLGEKHRSAILKIRDPNVSLEEAKALKSGLPCASIGALFQEGRGKDKPHTPTGLMCIDIDGKDNQRLTPNELKRAVFECIQVIYCSYSVSGKGVFAIVEISNPDDFEGHYKAIVRLFKERLGVNVDEACKDVSRLRFVSIDPFPFVRGNAVPFLVCDNKGKEEYSHTCPTAKQAHYKPLTQGDSLQAAEWCVSELERKGIDIAPNHDQWVRIGFALHELGNKGKDLFCRLSALWSKGTTKEKDIDNLWKRASDSKENGIGVGTFFYECAKHGIRVEYHADPEKVLEGIDLKQYTNIEPEKATSKNVFDLVGETGTIDDLL